MGSSLQSRVGFAAALVMLAIGCGDTPKLEIGGVCLLNSDCTSPLVCTQNICHEACRVTTDCPTGQSCMKVGGVGVCQLPAESQCAANLACGPLLICASDLRCRSNCTTPADCTPGQACVQGVCADSKDLDTNGNLPQKAPSVVDGGGRDAGADSGPDLASADAPSLADSPATICPTGEELCPCYGNNTCNAGLTCASQRCVPVKGVDASTGAGGVVGTGGVAGTGGVLGGTGGATGVGGSTGTGGVMGSGGRQGTGGVVGTGGSTAVAVDALATPDSGPDAPDAAPDVPVDTRQTSDAAPEASDTPIVEAGQTGTRLSLWDESTTVPPPSFCDWDNRDAELGVQFSSDVAGKIVAVRFYKDPANNGPHLARVWDGLGGLLAEAAFVDETPSGWQQVDLSIPVPVIAAASYVVSFHSVTGYSYAETFPPNRPPFHVAGGPYCYGTSCFPNGSFALNYWVDFVFVQ